MRYGLGWMSRIGVFAAGLVLEVSSTLIEAETDPYWSAWWDDSNELIAVVVVPRAKRGPRHAPRPARQP